MPDDDADAAGYFGFFLGRPFFFGFTSQRADLQFGFGQTFGGPVRGDFGAHV